MFRNIFRAALIGSASVIAVPALAGPGGGHGGMAMPGGAMRGGAMTSMRPMAAPMRATMSNRMVARPSTRSAMTMSSRMRLRASSRTNLGLRASKSQGLMHASITAIERASPQSVLARSSVRSSALPGLSTGLTVKGSGGATIGTVSRVVTGPDGRIRLVVATSSTGRMIRLAPNTLSVSGGVVTTTTGG